MRRIRVGFQLGEWTYGGTARSHFRIIEALDKSRFEPFALVWREGQNDLLPALEKILGDHVVFYERTRERMGPEDAYKPIQTNFDSVVKELGLDILHGARGGYPEWPLSTGRHARLQIETNIFGDLDPSPSLDRSIAICHYIADRRGKTDAVIYNPIPDAELEGPNLRADLGIPDDAIVCGRIGRPANFDPIAIEAFARAQKQIPNLWYLVVAPPPEMFEWVRTHDVRSIIYKAPTIADDWIAAFHRTLDIFLHFRSDGECHSTAIAQAMMYRVPVLSHRSRQYNGQQETIDNGGYVAQDLSDYESRLREWCLDHGEREKVGELAMLRAYDFIQPWVVRQIEEKYLEWVK